MILRAILKDIYNHSSQKNQITSFLIYNYDSQYPNNQFSDI
jgi:hypothetical protein